MECTFWRDLQLYRQMPLSTLHLRLGDNSSFVCSNNLSFINGITSKKQCTRH